MDSMQQPDRVPYELALLLLPSLATLLSGLHLQGAFSAPDVPPQARAAGQAAAAAYQAVGHGRFSSDHCSVAAGSDGQGALSHLERLLVGAEALQPPPEGLRPPQGSAAAAMPAAAAAGPLLSDAAAAPPAVLTTGTSAAPAAAPVHCRVLLSGAGDCGQGALAAAALRLLPDAKLLTLGLPSLLLAGDGDALSGALILLDGALQRCHPGKLLLVHLPMLEAWALEAAPAAQPPLGGNGVGAITADDAGAVAGAASGRQAAAAGGVEAVMVRDDAGRPALALARTQPVSHAAGGTAAWERAADSQSRPKLGADAATAESFVSAAWMLVAQRLAGVPRSQPVVVLATAHVPAASLPQPLSAFFGAGGAGQERAPPGARAAAGASAGAVSDAGSGASVVVELDTQRVGPAQLAQAAQRCGDAVAAQLCAAIRATAAAAAAAAAAPPPADLAAPAPGDSVQQAQPTAGAAGCGSTAASGAAGNAGASSIAGGHYDDHDGWPPLNDAEWELGSKLQQQVRRLHCDLVCSHAC